MEFRRYFVSHFFDWLSYTPAPLMDRVVTSCQSSPEQWTNVTNTFWCFNPLGVLQLCCSPQTLVIHSNSPSASNAAGLDAARTLHPRACATFTASRVQYCDLYEENKAAVCLWRQSDVMDTIRRRDVGVGEKIKEEEGWGGGCE